MSEITIDINGQRIATTSSTTILNAAKTAGISIPSLCNDDRLEPYGACRVCLVDVEGARAPMPACATKATDGMVIKTDSDEIIDLRKNIVELILSDHPSDCMLCEKCGDCELQDLAYQLGVRGEKYEGEKHPEVEREEDPFIIRQGDKCILCGRCVRICDEVQGANAIDFVNRGFNTIVTTPFNRALPNTDCELCGQCVSTCPTGSLTSRLSSGAGRIWDTKDVKTTCSYCGVGCTIHLKVSDNKVVDVTSNAGEGINDGNLCIKGKFGFEYINHKDRLTKPLIKDNGRFREASWDEAMDLVVSKLKDIKEKHGADALAGLSSAKCTNEENYLFQKVFRAAVGTNNVDHCARLCHASSVAGLALAFGSAAMTGSIKDIEQSKVILIIGSNTSEAHPIIGLAVKKAVRNGAKLIVADPRKIPMVRKSNKWLRHRPGTDLMLLNGLAEAIIDEGLEDKDFIANRTEGFDEYLETIKKVDMDIVEQMTKVGKDDLREAARLYATTDSGSILYSMGITQHICGTENVMAIANLALLTGNIGKSGTGVHPLRGQNNVQGSCDMGALPNLFPGYQSVTDDEIVKKFESAWGVKLPDKPGLTVTEIVDGAKNGSIKGVYVMAENPMMSDPDINKVEKALNNLDFLVVQDIFMTETARLADVVFPASSFAEKDGTFTNTERRVQLVNKAIDLPGEARQDWEILQEISSRLGYKSNFQSPAEIMEEVAAVTPQYAGIRHSRLVELGIQWPCTSLDHEGTQVLHKDKFTRGLGKFHPINNIEPDEKPDAAYPFVLTTGRILEHYHTGTMTRRSKAIDEIRPDGFVEISNADAQRLGIIDSELISVASRRGTVRARAFITERVPEGIVFMPFHFSESPANALTNPAIDPRAKIPEFKVCAVNISK